MNFISRFKLKLLRKKAHNLYDKRERGENVNVKNEIHANVELAKFYDKHIFDKKLPNAEIHALECYRAAAILGDTNAQYIFAKRQLEKGKFWDAWAKGMYGLPIHNNYASQYYIEALNYLEKAEEGGNPLAKRLHGMAYIHAWGVEYDKEKGFKLIIDSIDDEHAWDKATQIFTELGLNTPEFFSSIMILKQQKEV